MAALVVGGPAEAGETRWGGSVQVQLTQSTLPAGFAQPKNDGRQEQVRGMGASEDGAPDSPRRQDLSIILWDDSHSRPRSGGGSGQINSSVNGRSY